MKKSIILLILFFLVLSLSFANGFALDVGLGIPSETGARYEAGRFDFSVKVNTTYGIGGLIAYFLMDKVLDTSLPGAERFEYGNHLLHGLTVDAAWRAIDNKSIALSLGGGVTALHAKSTEGVFSAFKSGDMVLFNLKSRFDFKLGEKSSIYLGLGFPLFVYINYGGVDNANYAGFDFWAFVPTAVKEVEDGGWVNITAGKLALLFAALNFRIGYSYRF